MKFEETIQYLYDNYPKVFPNRENALNFLFLVGGTGFYWDNGELIEDDISGNDNVILKGDNKALQTIQDETMLRINKAIGIESGALYPLHDDCNLFTFPYNIKEDWMEGIAETVEMVLKYRNENVDNMNEWQKNEHNKGTLALNKLANKLGIV